MKNALIVLAITTALFFIGCGTGNSDSVKPASSGKSELTVSIGGQEKKIVPSSTWATHSVKSFSPNSDGSGQFKTSSTTIILANLELDKERGIASINKKKLDQPQQYRVHFGFSGAKGTDEKAEIKAGEYQTNVDRYAPNKVEFVTIYHVVDGKETAVELDDKVMNGKITISGLSGTKIYGSLDVTDGKNTVKGTFEADGDKSVK